MKGFVLGSGKFSLLIQEGFVLIFLSHPLQCVVILPLAYTMPCMRTVWPPHDWCTSLSSFAFTWSHTSIAFVCASKFIFQCMCYSCVAFSMEQSHYSASNFTYCLSPWRFRFHCISCSSAGFIPIIMHHLLLILRILARWISHLN